MTTKTVVDPMTAVVIQEIQETGDKNPILSLQALLTGDEQVVGYVLEGLPNNLNPLLNALHQARGLIDVDKFELALNSLDTKQDHVEKKHFKAAKMSDFDRDLLEKVRKTMTAHLDKRKVTRYTSGDSAVIMFSLMFTALMLSSDE